MSTPTQTEVAAKNHRRAVRFFWGLLIGATSVSLIGNIAHTVLPYIPCIVIQIGAAAVCLPSPSSPPSRHRPRRPCRSVRQGLPLGYPRLLQSSVRAHSFSASAPCVTC